MIGYKVGRLEVISESHKIGYNYYWNCLCSCGNHTVVSTVKLRKKNNPTRSCGCLNKERVKGIKHYPWFKQK